MGTTRTLAVYAAVLAGVFTASTAVGAAADPMGLSNAEPEQAEHGMEGGDAMVPGLASAEEGLRLVPATDVHPAADAAPYRFRIEGEDGTVTDFDVEHTKRMHLIVVRRDFVGFVHAHPRMAADGTWTVPLVLRDPGAYRVFADFVVDGDKHTLATDLFVPGDFTPVDVPPPAATADAGGGYTVELDGDTDVVVGEESELAFVVRKDGEVVDDVETYLGARGHLVALRDGDLGYLHVHADEDELRFEADFPTAGRYRLFLQLRHGGRVRTAAFTVDASETDR